MGQAQLLLIVLGVVLVGIAIIAGIQAYSTNNVKANLDAQVHDLMRVGSDIQTWVQKPQQFGGPAAYADLTEVDGFDVIGYETDGATLTRWINPNGTYDLTAGAAADVGPVIVAGENTQLGTRTLLHVCGITDQDIAVTTARDGEAPDTPTCPLN